MANTPNELPSVSDMAAYRDAAFLAVERATKANGVFGDGDLKAVGAFFRALGLQRAILRFEDGGDVEAFRGIDVYADPLPEHLEVVAAMVGEFSSHITEMRLTLNQVLQSSSPALHLSAVAGGAIVLDVNTLGFDGHTGIEVIVKHRRTMDC